MNREILRSDARLLKTRSQLVTKPVVSDHPHEVDVPPKSSDRYRLIRAFATWKAAESTAENRFSALGESLGAEYQIVVGTPDNPDSGACHQLFTEAFVMAMKAFFASSAPRI